MFHNLFDSHIHSANSPDGCHSIMYLAENAEAMGMMGMTITDHVECVDYDKQNFFTRIAQSMIDTAKASAAFRYRMSFARGIELGVTPGDYTLAEQILGLYPYDIVLGACHFNRAGEEYYHMDYLTMTHDRLSALLKEYFEDILELCRWGKYDVLAHLNLPLRWAARKKDACLDLTPFREQIEEILCILVSSGKGLELNMSGMRSALSDTMPPKWVISRYKELGGELITIGSDAHRAEDVGGGIAEGMQILKDAGFGYFAFYRGRKPVMLRIV